MKLFLLLFTSLAIAEESKPTVEQLQAQIVLLKAQLAEIQLAAKWDMIICSQPELMKARLVTTDAVEKLKLIESKPDAK